VDVGCSKKLEKGLAIIENEDMVSGVDIHNTTHKEQVMANKAEIKKQFKELLGRKDRTVVHLTQFIKDNMPQVWDSYSKLWPIQQKGSKLVQMAEEALG